ncbi:hypothetical protein SAMN06295905_1687 [Devosia lucknowensis]|uniref:AtuA-like ferredoxin-fold domain-containing protein n=1 Tax=Devosia lucknowensis TaxID=1096929 RepID=A0A1Y6F4H2_9HYPH|nr:hypothetical protein [Devosia lucknowensis]SMQ69366.1 hypothetical protein SAMN06295905_1687 [Devosia lucknowensis]
MSGGTRVTKLHAIAHGRSGDKGNRLNVNVIAYDERYWPILRDQVTAERVAALFAHRGVTDVQRYELPKLGALNFVIEDALEGGVNSSLAVDTHGKCLSYLVLGLDVLVPVEPGGGQTPQPALQTVP